ncbi:Ku protein [Terriglobus saanensis]|uniref:Non-homologous end joining protein Ku n=1 Tax=Terriglobus saanensis (strain ATCC BAA-1853 / DSM 23119 / SP1PR4) TaxID=401053 RepID=E8V3A8_TERSS|nr:Ku protein [Terriglobus saanensis]ADV82465.1 Ku protein [Terriglobus saanensis SP1PR4]
MARPYWSGQIQISLVSFSVSFFVATEAKSEIHFHQIHRGSGERVRHQKVSSNDDAPVEKSDIVKGYEYRKGEYIQIEPEEIEKLRVPSKHTIDVQQFVSMDEIDPEYFEKPYFVTPQGDKQVEAFIVVREALKASNKAALGKIAFGGREHVLAITAAGTEEHPGMMAYTMRYAEELRDPATYFSDIKKVKVEKDQLELAQELIKRKTAKFDPSQFHDEYEAALKEMVEAKVENKPIPQDEEPAPARGKVINLMDALRNSLKSDAKESTKVEEKERKVTKKQIPKASGKGPTLVPAKGSKVAAKTARRKSA